MKLLPIGVLIGIALGLVGFSLFVEKPEFPVGAAAGPVFTEQTHFEGGMSYGSGCFSTSTTGTLTAAVLDNFNCIYINPTGAGMGAVSLTLPASTTMQALIPKAGSCQQWFIDNSDTAAGTTTTVVAGTGVDVVGLDATGAGAGADVIDGLEFGTLTLCRERNGDVAAFVREWIHAD